MTTQPDAKFAIRLSHVSKKFGTGAQTFHAVRDISLDIAYGDIFGIIGKSGAGKSTLLRLINLLEQPDSGQVEVAGNTLTLLRKKQLRHARQTIGMIFQQFNLLQNATVFDNVAFPLRIHHGSHGKILSKDETGKRVRECLGLVDLTDKIDSYPAQLSGGQKQRVAIARALASHPDVLLCDEPTSALDSETTASILDVLAEINHRLGVTIVIVTHELAIVRALCRNVAIIDQGQIADQFAVDGNSERLTSRFSRIGGLPNDSSSSAAKLNVSNRKQGHHHLKVEESTPEVAYV